MLGGPSQDQRLGGRALPTGRALANARARQARAMLGPGKTYLPGLI